MKKIKIIIGLFLVLCCCAGCKNRTTKESKEYLIYYMDRDENSLRTVDYESRENIENPEGLIEELLEQLSLQTEDIDYRPIITGFTVKGYSVQENVVTLNLSDEYKLLEPVKEVLIRAAIVKTLTQLEGIELVNLQVNGENLVDNLGITVGVMSGDSFIDNTGEDMKKYEEVTLSLYFANAGGDGLVKVNRTLHYNTNIALEKLIVEQLISGPIEQKNKGNEQTIFPSLNPEIKIIGVNVKDSICYVNLNNAFLTTVNNVSMETAIYSLVNSLTELPGVLKVQFAVEGDTEITLGKTYNLSTLFERKTDLVQTEENKRK